MNESRSVEEMTREELQLEVLALRTKYIWGLQAEDFAVAVTDDNNPALKEAVIYSQNELSDADLRLKLYTNHKSNFSIFTWAEDVCYYAEEAFSKEDWNLVATMKERKLV